MNKTNLGYYSIWYKIGTNFLKNIVKSMTYNSFIIEW